METIGWRMDSIERKKEDRVDKAWYSRLGTGIAVELG